VLPRTILAIWPFSADVRPVGPRSILLVEGEEVASYSKAFMMPKATDSA
jgi:hypothetical protein